MNKKLIRILTLLPGVLLMLMFIAMSCGLLLVAYTLYLDPTITTFEFGFWMFLTICMLIPSIVMKIKIIADRKIWFN